MRKFYKLNFLGDALKALPFFMVVLMLFLGAQTANAQSTSSTITGNVNDGKDAIAEAVVTAVHMPTNTAFYAVTNRNGNYTLNNVIAGGPYNIQIEKMGYRTTMVQNVYAPIAESVVANIVAEKTSVVLKEVAIYGESDASGMNVQRSGVGTRIDNHAMEAIPTIDRSLNDVMKLTPQAAVVNGGFSVGGGNYRGSSVAVDGAMFNNSFGIGTNLPAGGAP
ncbi:MAG: carboxypeptidase-like regulatory domain-containing protein, partial [Bacteroidales bacterium]|nr:carboxypeptidase-like regulatory domain-containing protein [Bacteroidales bacterium]